MKKKPIKKENTVLQCQNLNKKLQKKNIPINPNPLLKHQNKESLKKKLKVKLILIEDYFYLVFQNSLKHKM